MNHGQENREAEVQTRVGREQACGRVGGSSDRRRDCGRTCFPAHRPADPRRGGLARGDPGPRAGTDPGGRPRDDRGAEMEEAVERDGGGSGLVARRDCLHRGDVRESRQAHVRPGGQHPGPVAPLQCQPRRQRAKGDRHPRRNPDRWERVQSARDRCGRPERVAGDEGQAGETPFRRQSANRQSGRRRPGASVHRRDAGLEE